MFGPREADLRLAAGRRQLGLQAGDRQADGARPVARPVALDRRRAGLGRAQRGHHRDARAAHPDRQGLDAVPQRLGQAGPGIEQIQAVAQDMLGERRIGLERRDQQVVGPRDVDILVDLDLAQVAQGRLEPARHRFALVEPVGAAEPQDRVEIEVRREGVVPGQPVADHRRLVVQERPDLADLGQRRAHQLLGVDDALGQARAARGEQDLADAVTGHRRVSALDRFARRAGQQVVERDGARDCLDVAGRRDHRRRFHRFKRRPEQRRILDIDQARGETFADMADLGEILRHQRIGRRDRHRRNADLHRAELQDREVQAVVAQDGDRVVAVMAVVEQPLRDPVRPVSRRSVGQVDPVAGCVALGEEGSGPGCARPAGADRRTPEPDRPRSASRCAGRISPLSRRSISNERSASRSGVYGQSLVQPVDGSASGIGRASFMKLATPPPPRPSRCRRPRSR